VRAVVRDLVADAVDDGRVARGLVELGPAEHAHLRPHALRRALAVHALEERPRERVLAPDEQADDLLVHRNTSTISFQYGQSCAQPFHMWRSAGTPLSWRSAARRRESSALRSSSPVAITNSVWRIGTR